ncbi:MAG: helix-turn-helix transcriptional regulator [Lachnospiraceae bacterium]|nr:helix-turn-helix transcriptional regulator [Lachnospiraceae bacterium]
MQYFGEKLKRIREERKISQTDLGRKIGVSSSTISAYEKSRKLPTLDTLKKICSVLD